MEHHIHALILFTILIIIVVSAVVISSTQVSTEPGGYFRIAQHTAGSSECFDTDGGANQFVRGAVSYEDWSFLDDCSVIVSDDGNVSTLYEGYCADATHPTIAQYNCTKGCENGACVR